MLIKFLMALGCGFDCASKTEIANVLELGAESDKIIYANPIKDPLYIKYARTQEVDMMTFDAESELYKIKLYHPSAKLVLRIKTDDSKSVHKFSSKFGCSLEEARSLIEKAKILDLNIVGVSFHVGSKCNYADSYSNAIMNARSVFKMGEENGMNMYLLDIGGGFPGCEADSQTNFEEIAKSVKRAVSEYFSDFKDLKIIAEPGRFFATKTHTLVFSVIGKKQMITEEGEKKFIYYMNDGIYGSFNCIKFDDATPNIIPVQKKNSRTYKSTVFGPTCDSIDTIARDLELPELSIGDSCYVENFGAYTQAAASTFNGFNNIKCHYVIQYCTPQSPLNN